MIHERFSEVAQGYLYDACLGWFIPFLQFCKDIGHILVCLMWGCFFADVLGWLFCDI